VAKRTVHACGLAVARVSSRATHRGTYKRFLSVMKDSLREISDKKTHTY
jgi:hypothetical protein